MKQKNEKKYASCNTCTIMLVQTAYRRAWWFRLVREPLRIGLIVMSKLYGIDAKSYTVRSENCYGCIRFMKTALKENSPLFNRLNNLINPVFDRIMERIVTGEEVSEAKRFARESTHEPKQSGTDKIQ
jgi:hypothetical protein